LSVKSLGDLQHTAPPNGTALGTRNFEQALQAASGAFPLPDGASSRLSCLQVVLPEGEREDVIVLQANLSKEDVFFYSNPSARAIKLRRPVAVDQGGRKLFTKWDKVDEVLHDLGFQRADEWYSSGPGSVNKLNNKVEAIIEKLRILELFTERLRHGGNLDTFVPVIVPK